MSKETILRIYCEGGIGDAILFTPTLRALAKSDPQRKIIIWYAHPPLKSVFENNPRVSSMRQVGRTAGILYLLTQGAKWLPMVKTDYGFVMPSILYPIRAARIIAELFNVTLEDERPELFLLDAELESARKTLSGFKRPWVAIHPHGQCSANKNWSMERWSELISRHPEMTFVQLGAKGEPLVQGVQDLLTTNLRNAFALIKECDAYVGVDSGLAHAAAALGTRGVVLFGPTTPTVWGHAGNINLYSQRYCSPCIDILASTPCPFSKACMNEISVEMVERALGECLNGFVEAGAVKRLQVRVPSLAEDVAV